MAKFRLQSVHKVHRIRNPIKGGAGQIIEVFYGAEPPQLDIDRTNTLFGCAIDVYGVIGGSVGPYRITPGAKPFTASLIATGWRHFDAFTGVGKMGWRHKGKIFRADRVELRASASAAAREAYNTFAKSLGFGVAKVDWLVDGHPMQPLRLLEGPVLKPGHKRTRPN